MVFHSDVRAGDTRLHQLDSYWVLASKSSWMLNNKGSTTGKQRNSVSVLPHSAHSTAAGVSNSLLLPTAGAKSSGSVSPTETGPPSLAWPLPSITWTGALPWTHHHDFISLFPFTERCWDWSYLPGPAGSPWEGWGGTIYISHKF